MKIEAINTINNKLRNNSFFVVKDNSIYMSAGIKPLEPEEYDYSFTKVDNQPTILINRASDHLQLAKISFSKSTPLCLSFSNKKFGPLIAIGFADGFVLLAADLTRKVQNSRPIYNHDASVINVEFHPSECSFLSASLDGTIGYHTFVDINNNEWKTEIIQSDTVGVTAALWINDNEIIAGCADGTLLIHKRNNNVWQQSKRFKIHSAYVRAIMKIDPKVGSYSNVVSCSDDQSVAFLQIDNNTIGILQKENNLGAAPVEFLKSSYGKTISLKFANDTAETWVCNANGKWSHA